MNQLEARSKVRELQGLLLAAPGKYHIDIKANHSFTEGLYIRHVKIPPDCVLVGKTHKKGHILLIHNGNVTMMDENGQHKLKGPHMMVCQTGTKRAFKAGNEWVDMMTIHANPTNTQNIELIEAELVENI